MRTVVALYDRFEDAQRAVSALHDAGFERGDINMVARDASGEYSRYLQGEHGQISADKDVAGGAATGAGIGAVLGGLGGILLGLGALAIPGIGPVIAAGPIVAGLAGAGVGAVAGGLLGALVDLGIPEEHAQYFAEGIRRGGTLVTLRTADERADEARNLLNRFNPVDIESRVRTWQQGNWRGFDQNAQPMTADEMEFNRDAYMPVTGTTNRDMDRDVNRDMNRSTDQDVNRDFNRSMDQDVNRDMNRSMDQDVNRGMGGQGTGSNYVDDRDRDQLRGSQSSGSGMGDQGTSFSSDVNQTRDQNWRNNDIPMTGGDSIFDRDDDDVNNMPRSTDTGMGEHMNDDVFSTERAHDDIVDIPVTGSEQTMDRQNIDYSQTGAQNWDRYDMFFRQDYATRYGTTGYGYDYYQPAYRYGYDLASDPRYSGYNWDQVEMEARRDYQRHGLSGAWEDFRDAVRHAWESVTRG